MIKELNKLIRRKNYDNFIKNGDVDMIYGLSDKASKDAKKMIINDDIKERLIVLNNQLTFLDNKGDYKKVYNESQVKTAKESLDKVKALTESLNFKKVNLQVVLDEALSKLNISEAVKIKTELDQINEKLTDISNKEVELKSMIANDQLDYENQMVKIKEKYDDVDIVKHEICDSEFSGSVIADYKKYRASQLVLQFLDSLAPDKKEEVLNENENLRGYLDVGENI